MEVHALAIPSAEPMNREGLPEVIRTWADTSLFWLQPGQSKQTAERATGGLNRQDPLLNADEEARLWSRGRILQAVCKISIQLSAQRAMKRNRNSSGTPVDFPGQISPNRLLYGG
jgi:hypothetical protein